MAFCNYQSAGSYSLTATGPSQRPQSAPAPTYSLAQAALSHPSTPPQTKAYVFDQQTRRFFLPHHPPATQLSFSTSVHATPLFHSIPIAPSAVSSN